MEATPTDQTADSVNARVVDALAIHTDADPLDMEPLYDVVDPDALELLVARGTEVRVSFDYGDHTVVVDGDGTVSVDGQVYDDTHAEGVAS